MQERMAPSPAWGHGLLKLNGKATMEGRATSGAACHWRSVGAATWRLPRHVANSMAMEGEPVDEAWIRERLAPKTRERLIRLAASPSPSQPATDSD